MNSRGMVHVVLSLMLLLGCRSTPPTPPMAQVHPRELTLHGETRVDNYYYLNEKTNPQVLSYLRAEKKYADAMVRPLKPLREKLYEEALARIKEDDQQVPYWMNYGFYYSRTEKSKQYPIYCRKLLLPHHAPREEILLDLNRLAKGKEFLSLDVYSVSEDGNLLAYSTDETGFREFTLRIKDLRSGRTLTEHIENVTSCAWAADNQTLYYVVENEPKRPYRVYRHQLGQSPDTLVYEETDALFNLEVKRTRSKAYILIVSDGLATSEVRYIPAADPARPPVVIQSRRSNIQYDVDHIGSEFFIRVNDTGRNFRLVRAPTANPSADQWREMIPARADTSIERIDCFNGRVVMYERSDATPTIGILDLATEKIRYIDFPEAIRSIFPGDNAEFENPALRYVYQSPNTPPSTYDYDFATDKSTLLKRQEVRGGFDPANYVCERLYAKAADGQTIPITLARRKDSSPGPAPMLLYAYGSYGFPTDADFSLGDLNLLDRGVVCAIAHVRGGGDRGKTWHDAGRMMNKINTFTDFIACAEHLIQSGRTAPDRLIIQGGSAGGLLISSVLNMKPGLFKAAVDEVPFVDVLTTMSDESLPLTTQEYVEWGNPQIPAEYQYMKRYSPYDNIARQNYPAILVRTSLNDSQVMYFEPAGHGGASGRYDRLRDMAYTQAFVLWQLGIDR
jgi:oligopeptidase B